MAKVKGSALVEVVKFLRSQGEAGRRGTPEAQRHYLEERVLPASWYPEEDLLALLRAMVQFLPGDRESALANAGRFSARTHSEGVYAHLLAPTDDPLSLPRRGFALWASQHDSGKMRVELDGAAGARIELSDFALPSREMCLVLGGYCEEMMRLAGLAVTEVREVSCRLDGAPRCAYVARWQPNPALPSRS
jgi:hypothetical protein